ncbi:MAG: hypothetical protein HY909_01885 [Deltaproteobacteria bacterium]|nr:hypothetical protein [Deltaproteobacteria bacterium]
MANAHAWVLLGALTLPALASAQTAQEQVARADLLRQAEEARQASDHARALDLASRAGQLRMTPSVRLLIAQEHATLGHTLEALALSTLCATEARADAALNNRERILAACTALEESLQARVARVTVRVATPAPEGLRIAVQGAELRAALWGIEVPVLPGRVTVEATAPGRQALRQDLDLVAGATQVLTVALAAATAAPPPAPPTTTAPLRAPTTTAAPPLRASTAPATAPRPVLSPRGPGAGPWVVAGVGVASFGLAGVFFGLRGGAVQERDRALAETAPRCDEDAARCDYTSATEADARARTWNALTNVALGVGASAVVGGVVWWLLAKRRGEPRTPTVGWSLSPGPGSLTVSFGGAL